VNRTLINASERELDPRCGTRSRVRCAGAQLSSVLDEIYKAHET